MPPPPAQQPAPTLASRVLRSAALWTTLVSLAIAGYPLQYIVRYSGFHNFSPDVVASSKASGDIIAAALGQHHAREGQYPASIEPILAALAPEHRAPTAGERLWRYIRRPDGSCQLSFKVRGPNYIKWYAESAADFRWVLDQ